MKLGDTFETYDGTKGVVFCISKQWNHTDPVTVLTIRTEDGRYLRIPG